MKVFLILLFFSFSAFAQNVSVTSTETATVTHEQVPLYEGRVTLEGTESSEAIRKLLVRDAIFRLISDELKKQNLNAELFFKKMDTKVELSFFEEALPSYLVKEEGQDEKNPKVRFIRITGKKDTDAIRRLYFKTLRDTGEFRFSSLIFYPQIELVNCSYADLFMENPDLLLNSLSKSWRKWFVENLSKNIGDFVISDSATESKIMSFMKEKDQNNEVVSDLSGSLSLKLRLRIEKISENIQLGERTFVFHGVYGLQDIGSGLLVTSGTIPDVKFQVLVHEKKPEVELASSLYRFPLADFLALSKKLDEFSQKPQLFTLELKHLDSVMKLMSVGDLLMKLGTSLQLKATIKRFDGKNGALSIQMQGEKGQFLALLKSLHDTKLSSGEVTVYHSEEPFALDFKTVGAN